MQHMWGGIFPPLFLCYLAAMPEDFSLNDFGPIVLLQPKTEFAFSWAQENLSSNFKWCGSALAIKRQDIEPVLYMMMRDNLILKEDAPTPTRLH